MRKPGWEKGSHNSQLIDSSLLSYFANIPQRQTKRNKKNLSEEKAQPYLVVRLSMHRRSSSFGSLPDFLSSVWQFKILLWGVRKRERSERSPSSYTRAQYWKVKPRTSISTFSSRGNYKSPTITDEKLCTVRKVTQFTISLSFLSWLTNVGNGAARHALLILLCVIRIASQSALIL